MLHQIKLDEAESDELLANMKDKMQGMQEVPLVVVIDLIIPYIKESDFVLKKRYTIRDSVQTAFGKWP